jgi:hypothetical protein
MHMQQPSRAASVDDEAIAHFFTEYNYIYFASDGPNRLGNGVDCVLPIFRQDASSGGPMATIVLACGLAALGNVHGSRDLVMAARGKQALVLGQLRRQLSDPKTAVSDSSILTSITLGIFEVSGLTRQTYVGYVMLTKGTEHCMRRFFRVSGHALLQGRVSSGAKSRAITFYKSSQPGYLRKDAGVYCRSRQRLRICGSMNDGLTHSSLPTASKPENLFRTSSSIR